MNKEKKINWLGNVIYFNLSKLLFKRDLYLWVYGSLGGKKYDDNSKFLFEHVNANHFKSVRSVWLANNDKVVNDVREKGGEAYTFNSPEGRRIAHKAGVAIYTHSLEDFGLFPHVGGAKLVFLGHGAVFKQTCNAKRHGLSLFFKKMLDKPFSWIKRDITISTSDFNSREVQKVGGLDDKSKIVITGQPRNDLFKHFVKRNFFLEKLGISKQKKIILYMPTYRMDSMGKYEMNDIVKDLYESQALNEMLEDQNSVFIVKPHPRTPKIELKQRNNFRILNYYDIDSNQELMAIGDILVTDYSSCCIDFALLGRPIIFYRPDEEKFFKYSENVCEEYFDFSNKNSSSSPEELAKLLKAPSLASTIAINELYESPLIKGTCYSENVYRAICEQIGIDS